MYELIQMKKRLTKIQLLEILMGWNLILRRRVRMIACGGTAMTLLGVKESTKDVDFMVPNHREYNYLIGRLKDLGYKPVTAAGWQREGELFQFDLFQGNNIHTTRLLESPLEEGRHTVLQEYTRLYIGILNEYDLIVSKLMRGSSVDFDDCLTLATALGEKLERQKLADHFHEMISYDISQDRIRPNMDTFLERLNKRDRNDR